MLYQRHLFKELTYTAIAIFLVLLVILLSSQLINLLGDIAGGSVALSAMGMLLIVWLLHLTPLLLILTAFISILTVFTRYWRDSEMVVWLSSGFPLQKWIKSLMIFAIPFMVPVAIIALWGAPWAESKGTAFAHYLKQKQDMFLIEEGVFRAYGNDDTIYFVESFDTTAGVVENIFLRGLDKNGDSLVVLAHKGELQNKDNLVILHLKDGVRYTGKIGTTHFERVHFDQADLTIASTPHVTEQEIGRRTASPMQLWQNGTPKYLAELMWRISLPITVPILALLAFALSYYNPRSGQTYNILFAVAAFFLYQALLNFLNSQIGNGKMSFWFGLFPAHFLMLAIAIGCLYWRINANRRGAR